MGSEHVVVLKAHVRVLALSKWFPQRKLNMSIYDVYFDKSEIVCDVRVKTTFVLTPTFQLIIGNSMIFEEYFAYMWLEDMDTLHTSNANQMGQYW